MPNNATAKIKSAPNRARQVNIILSISVVTITLFLTAFMYIIVHRGTPNTDQYTLLVGGNSELEQHSYRNPVVSKPWTYKLRPARTAAEQAQGLSGTKSLAKNAGMLFIFSDNQNRCFWMKDMNYALDIIWVSADKKVTHIEKSLAPQTYPKEYCAEAQYVIELTAGQADASHMTLGQTLRF